jgi:hypothetical protein
VKDSTNMELVTAPQFLSYGFLAILFPTRFSPDITDKNGRIMLERKDKLALM